MKRATRPRDLLRNGLLLMVQLLLVLAELIEKGEPFR